MHPTSRLAALFVAGGALVSSATALAQSSLAEDFTAGPKAWNGGTAYYGNSLDGEFELVPDRWYLHGTFLLETDALGTLHQTYQLGGSFQPNEAWELGAFGFFSPHASGQEIVLIPNGFNSQNKINTLGSSAVGGDVYGSYEVLKGSRSVTLLGELNYSHFDIDQNLYYQGGPKVYTGTLNQVSLSLGASGRVGKSRLTLSGTYYVYDQDPTKVGQISNSRGLFVTSGGLSTGSIGLPTAPMTWNAVASFRQRIRHLLLYFTYAFLDYVDGNGIANVFTAKVAYDLSDSLRLYAGDTLQVDSLYVPAGASPAVGQPPPVSNLILVGLLYTFY
jgi:hypothetical protein